MAAIITLLLAFFNSAAFREILAYFLKDLEARRANDPRLIDLAKQIMLGLEKTLDGDGNPLPGEAKYREAFAALTGYAKAFGLDVGAAGIDSIIALVLPTVRAQVNGPQ